ncbi:MAG: EAL domain-containing protein [Acidimicrobiales bacterium]
MDTSRFGALLDLLPDAVGIIDSTATLRAANSSAERLFGWSRDEWIGRNLLEMVHPDDVDWAISSLATVTGRELGTPIEMRVKSAEGWLLVELVGRAAEVDGEPVIFMSARDLTERRRWEIARDDTAMFRSVLHHAASLTILADADATISAVSAAMIRLTGFGPEATIGRSLVDLVIEADQPRMVRAIDKAKSEAQRRVTTEVLLAGRDRDAIPCQLSIVNLIDDPTVGGLVVSGHDISELWRARTELEHMAGHDPLTGLANRGRLSEELARRLDPNCREAGPVAVAFIDLDRFKPVNDLYGHETGDELLTMVAARLRDALRDDDVVARFGGDEFIAVMPDAGISTDDLAERIVSALSTPFRLSVGVVQISASVGVVAATPGDDPDTVLAEADNAMYAVKNDVKHTPSLRNIATRRRLADGVTHAFERDEFTVHYQPIIDLQTNRWVGFEALSRWNHPELGLLLPADFIDIVEDIGLGLRLGAATIETICQDLGRLRDRTGLEPSISVNASADEVTNPDYASTLTSALNGCDISPDRFTIEISERSILGRGGRTGRVVPANLAALAEQGVGIAVDDFGTGYSSLTHLVSFPIDRIKIDRSFVAGVVDDAQRRSVIAALVGLAQSTGMSVVAEGIADQDQLDMLLSVGCHLGQGFFMAKPMAYEGLEAALT